MQIAITGIDCRFPGAPNKDAFWELLLAGGDGVSPIPAQRWDADAWYSKTTAPGAINTREAGFIADPDAFDNEFFGITPAEAAAMDPQQRMLLECAWRALEDSGVDPGSLQRSPTGVYVGVMGNEWAHTQLTDYAAITPYVGAGNGYCMTANRISYHLGLHGPSLAVDTACSSSLVAVHLACAALRSGECDRAVVGGVNLIVTPALHIFYAQAGLSAPDGRCKPFSADCGGIGRGEGVGVVVLMRLQDAVLQRVPIYAVIRGGAVNHDGRSNGLTAPSRTAQVDVIRRAHAAAGVIPADVRFVEAHGTGTVLGDMIEAKALGEAYGPERDQPLLVGSVKGNIGHAEGAAGIAGVIKAALALRHGVVPPTRTARENPQLRLSRLRLKLPTSPVALGSDEALAGVSSFGLGGTNAHLLLSTAPDAPRDEDGAARPGVFTLSGPNLDAIQRNAAASAALVRRAGESSLTDICAATNRVKRSLRYRLGIGAIHAGELAAVLEAVASDRALAERLAHRPDRPPRIAFAFTGQGSQHPGMTRALIESSPAYRRRLAEADRAVAEHLGGSIVEAMGASGEDLGRTRLAQPAIFAVGYALASTLVDLGIEPEVVLGHSVGELAAAVIAGVLPLAQAAALVTARGSLMDSLPEGGGMLSVRCRASELEALVSSYGSLAIAAYNGPRSVVVSGALDELAAVEADLVQRGVPAVELNVSHAFHSPLMEPMLAGFRERARAVSCSPAAVALVSTVTGEPIPGETMDADYWTRQIRGPVRFVDAVGSVARLGVTHVVEVGPRPVLTRLMADIPAADGLSCLSATSPAASAADLVDLVATLYREGASPRWDRLYEQDGARSPAPLWPYEFSRANRFWSKPMLRGPRALNPAGSTPDHAPALEPRAPRPAVPATPGDPERAGGVGPADSTTYQLVVDALCKVSGNRASSVGHESRLSEDLGLDSMMLMTLKRELETSLSAVAELDVGQLLPHLATVGTLVAHLDDVLQLPATSH